MDILQNCVALCERMGLSIDALSNGWFVVQQGSNQIIYERLSELYNDLSTGRLIDFLY